MVYLMINVRHIHCPPNNIFMLSHSCPAVYSSLSLTVITLLLREGKKNTQPVSKHDLGRSEKKY